MSNPVFYPRSVERRLVEALEDSPVVLIHGPRQCGKTTLAQITCAPNYVTWGRQPPDLGRQWTRMGILSRRSGLQVFQL